MNRLLKMLIGLCCLLAVAATLGSCGVGDLPDDETLRKDFENYLNYHGDLPFSYTFKSFEVQDQVKNKADKTSVVTIEASVVRKYGDEIYNDITYVADLHYANIDGKWNPEQVIVKSSIVEIGFDLESIFIKTIWKYDEENSRTEADELEEKGVPLGFHFKDVWDKDLLSVTVEYTKDNPIDYSATYIGLEAYAKRYSETKEWDFRIVYRLDNGAVIDFVHLSGSLFDAENWVIGYRDSTIKERSLALYYLESTEE